MSEKAAKKKPELPQPGPDIVLPDGNGVADFGAHAVVRTPSPRNEVLQETPLGRRAGDEEQVNPRREP